MKASQVTCDLIKLFLQFVSKLLTKRVIMFSFILTNPILLVFLSPCIFLDEASFEIEPNVFGTILLCKESFIKCFATRNGVKSEMVYLPVYLHVNDFVPHTAHFKDKIHDKIKMFILR